MSKEKIIELSDVEKLCNSIVEYNIAIYTTTGLINTDEFNIVGFSNTQVGGLASVIDSTQQNGSIMLAYNPKGNTRIGVNELKKGQGYKTVVIPYNTIESFTIKSKRNFLMNQVDMTKQTRGTNVIEELENKLTPKLFHDSNRTAGKLNFVTDRDEIVLFWKEITVNFGVGEHNNSAQIDLEGFMREIMSVQITPSTSSNGDVWDLPTFQFALIDSNRLRIQIMASKGGTHTIHLLVIGKK